MGAEKDRDSNFHRYIDRAERVAILDRIAKLQRQVNCLNSIVEVVSKKYEVAQTNLILLAGEYDALSESRIELENQIAHARRDRDFFEQQAYGMEKQLIEATQTPLPGTSAEEAISALLTAIAPKVCVEDFIEALNTNGLGAWINVLVQAGRA